MKVARSKKKLSVPKAKQRKKIAGQSAKSQSPQTDYTLYVPGVVRKLPETVTENLSPPVRKRRSKPPLAVIPYEFEQMVANAFAFGMIKYQDDWDAFKRGAEYKFSDLVSVVKRHLGLFMSGEDFDLNQNGLPDRDHSGLEHIGHAGSALAILAWLFVHRYEECDDRHKPTS